MQNSSWNEIISIERRISTTSVKLARWKVASDYHHGSIHGESKSLMQDLGRSYESDLRSSKGELMRKKTHDMEHSSSSVTRYRVVLDRRKKDDVRLLLFKPDAHFKARYPLSLVQEGKVNSSEAPIPEHEISILGASIRGEVMDLQMNRMVMYTWDVSNRRVTLSLSAESGLEQLCQILSAMNTYGAILDNRTWCSSARI